MSAASPTSPTSLDESLNPARTALEFAGKSIAVVGVVVYVCGFLITSIHQSGYGFSETNPLRPHIISAGAWFLLLTGAPIVTWIRYRLYSKGLNGFFVMMFPFYGLSYLLSGLPSEIFELPTNTLAYYNRQSLHVSVALLGFFIAVMLTKSVKMPSLLLPCLSLGLTIYFVPDLVKHLIETSELQRGSIALWFFVMGVAAEVLYHNSMLGNLRIKDWAGNTVYFLVVLWLFATYYYPHIKRSWGGGSPLSVVIWFSKESAVRPGQQIPVQLIDESDVGFYILGHGDKKALFIPRNAVSALYYADNSSDVALLR